MLGFSDPSSIDENTREPGSWDTPSVVFEERRWRCLSSDVIEISLGKDIGENADPSCEDDFPSETEASARSERRRVSGLRLFLILVSPETTLSCLTDSAWAARNRAAVAVEGVYDASEGSEKLEEWVFSWRFKFEFWLKVFRQKRQLKGFTTVCTVFTWRLRLLSTLKEREHISHPKGLEPEWVRRWISSFERTSHFFPQILHS